MQPLGLVGRTLSLVILAMVTTACVNEYHPEYHPETSYFYVQKSTIEIPPPPAPPPPPSLPSRPAPSPWASPAPSAPLQEEVPFVWRAPIDRHAVRGAKTMHERQVPSPIPTKETVRIEQRALLFPADDNVPPP